MERSAHNGFIYIYVAVPNLQIVATLRISADPGFVLNGCTLAAKIGQGYQVASLALLTFRKIDLFHGIHLPTEIRFSSVYTKH